MNKSVKARDFCIVDVLIQVVGEAHCAARPPVGNP